MKGRGTALILVGLLLFTSATAEPKPESTRASSESLEKLADDFWKWRAKEAPFTGDDVNRIERPDPTTAGRDWSRKAIETRLKDLAGFEARWE